MANEVTKTAAKGNKPAEKKQNKFLRAVTGLPKRIWTAIQNTWAELKKVTWPSRKDLINNTLIVIAFMVSMAILIGLLDLGSSQLISLIIKR